MLEDNEELIFGEIYQMEVYMKDGYDILMVDENRTNKGYLMNYFVISKYEVGQKIYVIPTSKKGYNNMYMLDIAPIDMVRQLKISQIGI